ncbi:hypothetical protein QL285_081748 [Trifolium repens]|jgi:hypothetical protein|nr:hypothetical protein QL285_081748 [Trifolium repens]
MKRASEFKKRKKKEEATTSRLRQNRQSKLIVKQEVVTSESDDTDSDYAEFLKTYDPEKEYSDSDESPSEADPESPEIEESKKED